MTAVITSSRTGITDMCSTRETRPTISRPSISDAERSDSIGEDPRWTVKSTNAQVVGRNDQGCRGDVGRRRSPSTKKDPPRCRTRRERPESAFPIRRGGSTWVRSAVRLRWRGVRGRGGQRRKRTRAFGPLGPRLLLRFGPTVSFGEKQPNQARRGAVTPMIGTRRWRQYYHEIYVDPHGRDVGRSRQLEQERRTTCPDEIERPGST